METDLEAMIEASFAVDDQFDVLEDDEPSISSNTFNDSGVGGASFSRSSNLLSTINTFNQSSTGNTIKDVFYCENYFDLNDILSQSQRVSVKFQRDIPNLGFIDSSSTDDDTNIKKGTKSGESNMILFWFLKIIFILELPLWLVKELNADNVISVTVPKGYNQVYREILEADANCVNLNKLGPNFYRFGQHLSKMNLPDSEDIANSLLDTFTQRFNRLVNFSLSGSNVITGINSMSSVQNLTNTSKNRLLEQTKQSNGDDTQSDMISYKANLDNWEKSILNVGQQTIRQMKRWSNRDIVKVEANDMVISLNKRKRLIEQHRQLRQQNINSSQQTSTSTEQANEV